MDIATILDKVVSHALSLGVFAVVNQHEPKTAPGRDITAAVWVDSITPAIGGSGLASTSGRLVLKIRIYQNFVLEPQDSIDPMVLSAVDQLISTYSGDFTLDDTVREVDLLGHYGIPLAARAGYLPQDNVMFRVMDIDLPLIINDIWTQES